MLAPCTWPRAWGGRRTRPTSAVSFELTDYGRGAASLGSLRPLRRLTIPAHRAGGAKGRCGPCAFGHTCRRAHA